MSSIINNNFQYITNNNSNEKNIISLCNDAINIMDLIIKEINSSKGKNDINNSLANSIKTLLVSFSANINNNNNNNNSNKDFNNIKNNNNNNNNNNNFNVYNPPPAPILKGISCEIPFDLLSPLDLNSPQTFFTMPTSTSSTPSSSSPSSPTSSSTPFPPVFNLSQDNFNQQIINKPIEQQYELSPSPITLSPQILSSQQQQPTNINLPIINIPPPFYLDDISDKLNSIDWDKIKVTDFNFFGSLGSGSFGTAKLCRHRESGIFFCSKTLRRNNIIHEKHKEHVQNEVNIMLSTNHPFLVKTYTTFGTPSKIHFIMEYASKKDLFYHLRASKQFNEEVTKVIVAEIVSAIDYLHRENIIYRDLKPENILVDDKGHIKLTDFGFSKKTLFNTTSVCGTLPYMAPEILISNVGHGKAVDWWALGVVIYELITGILPFENSKEFLLNRKHNHQPLVEMNNELFSEDLKDLVNQFLQIDPLNRIGTNGGGQSIKNHRWFSSINWNELESKLNNGPLFHIDSFKNCELNLNLSKSKSYNENNELCKDNFNLQTTQSFNYNQQYQQQYQIQQNQQQQQFFNPQQPQYFNPQQQPQQQQQQQQFYFNNQTQNQQFYQLNPNNNLYHQSTPQPTNNQYFFNHNNFNFQQQNFKLNNPYIIQNTPTNLPQQPQQDTFLHNNQTFQFNGTCAKISSGTNF